MRVLGKLALAAFVLSLFATAQATAGQSEASKFTFETEALFLHRNMGKNVGVSVTTNTHSQVLGTKNLDFGFRPGARFTLGYHPDPSNSVELSYFGLHNYSSSKSATCFDRITNEPCIGAVFGNTNGWYDWEEFGDPDPTNGAGAIYNKIKYESRLHNVELNYKRHLSAIGNFLPTLLFGFRYMSVPEKFSIFANGEDENNGPVAICCLSRMDIQTENRLVGLQVGGDGTYRMGSVDFALKAKAGVFVNWASQRTGGFAIECQGNALGGACEGFQGHKSNSGAAGVGEGGLFATWNVHRNVALTGGYQVLYIGGLALAPENMPTVNARNAIGQINNSGSAFYHGPSIGVKVSFGN